MKLQAIFVGLVIVALSLFFLSPKVNSLPVGANVTSNTSSNWSAAIPSRTDAGGTITTMVLDAQSQDDGWKGYVGNISGKFTLDDASGYSIYDWSFTVTEGEVYISRAASPSWSTAICANTTIISNEQNYFGMTAAEYDIINKTFNETIHQSFRVGVVDIVNSSCSSAFTYVNDSKYPYINESTPFQEVLLQTGTDLIYAALLETDNEGFHTGYTYDFQAIVPDNRTNGVTTTYYFWAELGT
ncbi:hypothetical protein C4573_04930 [Candidatus Woesearchaeota archaeon]|nr:MAG: hypothetical protein C4573_04930 [Candidatus Woesearchaeota archaeon]